MNTNSAETSRVTFACQPAVIFGSEGIEAIVFRTVGDQESL
jgi:hypothetical protein